MTFEPIRLDRVEFAAVVATPWTEWTFARLHATSGASADVELGSDRIVSRLLADQVSVLRGAAIAGEADVITMLGVDEARLKDSLSSATAMGALRSGVIILQAMENGITLTERLGGKSQVSVPLYANINRSLFATRRTVADFAKAAERAVTDGFRAVKCAPFDEVGSHHRSKEAVRQAEMGIRRVAAVRAAVGPSVAVMVDCHGRFDIDSAVIVGDKLGELGIEWFEEPIRPNRDPFGSAQIASRVPMTVAGGEMGYGKELFASLIRNGAVNVIMPDVMYCGSVSVAVRAGIAAVNTGSGVSLHSPSGPVSLLTGGHATAAISGAMPLEHAVHEVDWRADLLTPPERIEHGRLQLPPSPGLGANLNWDLLRRIGRVWK